MRSQADEVVFSAPSFHATALAEQHWPIYQSLYGCAETMRFVGPVRTPVQMRADFERAVWFGATHPERHRIFAIRLGNDAAAVALCGYQCPRTPRVFELGALILPSWQRHGLAIQVFTSLEQHLRQQRQPEGFSLHFQADHPAMKQVANRLAYAIKPAQEEGYCLATKTCTAPFRAV